MDLSGATCIIRLGSEAISLADPVTFDDVISKHMRRKKKKSETIQG